MTIGYYILFFAPMDQVFVGPFETSATAEAYILRHCKEGHDADIMTLREMLDNQRKYGEIPVQEPRQ